MKKVLAALLVAATVLLLAGCVRVNATYDISPEDFHSADRVEIYDAQGTLVKTISDKQELEAFFEQWKVEKWTLLSSEKKPDDSALQYEYLFYGVAHSGSDATEILALTMKVYNNRTVALEIFGVGMVFRIPASDERLLTNP